MGFKKGFFAIWAVLLVVYIVGWIVFEMDYRTRAANLYGGGEYTRAIDLFNSIIAGKSDNRDIAEAIVARGLARLRLGDLRGALDDAEKGLSLWPGYTFGYLLRSNVRLSSGDRKSALDDCNSVVEATNDPWSYWGRGNVRRDMGDIDGALADYDKAVETKPNLIVEAWDRLRPLRPVEAFYTDRSIARRFRGDLDGAAADVEAALKRNGKFPAAILNRGLVFLLQGKQDQAQGEFKRFADLRPDEKRYLDAEIEWARAGVFPNAAMVFLARTKGPTGGEADEAKSERPPAQQPPVAPREDEPASQPEQPVAEKQETGVIAFLKRLLPRYVTLICGIALLLVYTGTWLVLNDMKQMLAEEVPHQHRKPLQVAVYTIKFRRVLSLIAGAGLVVAYFLDKRMPMFGVLIIGAFFLSSLNKSGNARQLVTDAKTQK